MKCWERARVLWDERDGHQGKVLRERELRYLRGSER